MRASLVTSVPHRRRVQTWATLDIHLGNLILFRPKYHHITFLVVRASFSSFLELEKAKCWISPKRRAVRWSPCAGLQEEMKRNSSLCYRMAAMTDVSQFFSNTRSHCWLGDISIILSTLGYTCQIMGLQTDKVRIVSVTNWQQLIRNAITYLQFPDWTTSTPYPDIRIH